jgi:predicted HTH transcriptional regulator
LKLLEHLGAVVYREGELCPTVAGLLVFGREVWRLIPQSRLSIVRYPGLTITRNILDSVVVTLYAADLSKLAEEERTTRWAEQGLNERQIRALEYLTTTPSLTRQKYSELCQTSTRTAARDLRDLLERGLIEQHGGGRWVRYSLVER